jgi:hypothetical protein
MSVGDMTGNTVGATVGAERLQGVARLFISGTGHIQSRIALQTVSVAFRLDRATG